MSPSTLHGFSYPSPFDVPDVPADMQRLAEQLDPFIPLYVKPTTTDTNNTAVAKGDAQLLVNMPATGVYLVEAFTAYSCPNVAVDVQQSWSAATGISLLSRFVTGPEVAMTSTASSLMVNRPLSQFLTAQGFGIASSGNNFIRDEMLVNVTIANAVLRLLFNQNVSTAGVDVTRQPGSYMVLTRQTAV